MNGWPSFFGAGEVAWAASRARGTYLRAIYHRIARRRGRRRALVALGHRLLLLAYHVSKQQRPYTELGERFLDLRHLDSQKNYLVRKLWELGFEATLRSVSQT